MNQPTLQVLVTAVRMLPSSGIRFVLLFIAVMKLRRVTVTPRMRGSSNERKYLCLVEKNSAHENSEKFSFSNK